MADRTIKPDDTHDLVLQNNHGDSKIEINENDTIVVTSGGDLILQNDDAGAKIQLNNDDTIDITGLIKTGALYNHLCTIDLSVSPYTSTGSTGTVTVGPTFKICNIFNQSGVAAYDHYLMHFDHVSSTADSKIICKMITGTNGASGETVKVGHITAGGVTGLTVQTGNWYFGCLSGPDQDGNTHNSQYTATAYATLLPDADLKAISFFQSYISLPTSTNVVEDGDTQIYSHGMHDHTDSATGPFHSMNRYVTDLSSTVKNGLEIGTTSGNFDSGKIRIYGRRKD